MTKVTRSGIHYSATQHSGTTDWTPIRESSLLDLVSQSVKQMDDEVQHLWKAVKLPQPELWQQHPWGDEGCGFWVVAVFGRTCVYYNDISAGFCQSTFRHWGSIDRYTKDDPRLEDLLSRCLLTEIA